MILEEYSCHGGPNEMRLSKTNKISIITLNNLQLSVDSILQDIF